MVRLTEIRVNMPELCNHFLLDQESIYYLDFEEIKRKFLNNKYLQFKEVALVEPSIIEKKALVVMGSDKLKNYNGVEIVTYLKLLLNQDEIKYLRQLQRLYDASRTRLGQHTEFFQELIKQRERNVFNIANQLQLPAGTDFIELTHQLLKG